MTEPRCTLTVDGRPVQAEPGSNLAVALLQAGCAKFRESCSGQPRAPLCAMGICYECLVTVDGRQARACLEPVRAGMEVRTHD
ncbi:MAG: (2Fe-2S)-binding protein [Holophaga sp.]|jgi:sarcosine oxidase subunit alpha